MNRRDFLKSAGAVAVATAFHTPAAPLTFEGVPLVFDEPPVIDAAFLRAFSEHVFTAYKVGDVVEMEGALWRCRG